MTKSIVTYNKEQVQIHVFCALKFRGREQG